MTDFHLHLCLDSGSSCGSGGDGVTEQSSSGLRDQQQWSLRQCVNTLTSSVESLRERLSKLSEGDHLVWDKDDEDAMDFVAACANIRSHIFNIPQKTRFQVKCKIPTHLAKVTI